MNRDKQLAIALQMNRLMQLNLQSMTLSDEVAMEVAIYIRSGQQIKTTQKTTSLNMV